MIPLTFAAQAQASTDPAVTSAATFMAKTITPVPGRMTWFTFNNCARNAHVTWKVTKRSAD
jgi:hypothetical protein